MINIFIPSGSWPFSIDNNGLALRLDSTSIKPLTFDVVNSVCVCRCEYTEKVFSESGAIINLPNNDKTAFLFTKQIPGDTIDIYLCYGITRTLITDDTYGSFYSAGYFSLKPLYVGFLADWNKIYNSLGAGQYWFEIETTLLGVSDIIYSIYYDLKLFSDLIVDKTVRIETWNTGVILSSEFDYASLLIELPGGWYQSFRIGGKLLPKMPKLTIDNYYNQDYELMQIQDKITDTYELETSLIPASISNQLIYDNLLANKILISDFNIYNEEVVRQVSLYPQGEIGKKVYSKNKNCIFTIKFSTKKDDNIKNNF